MKESALPVRTQDASFHDMMAEQLRHAPWLALSLVVHAVVLLVVWLLLPPQEARRVENHAMVTPAAEPIEPPTEQPIEQPKVEPTEPQIVENVPTEIPTEDPTDTKDAGEVTGDDSPTLSAFTSNQWSTAVGIGSGCTGKGLKGEGGRGHRGPVGNPINPTLDRALDWLARHQDQDGRWDCDQFMKHDARGEPCDGAGNPVHDVGVTALALMAFLGDGHTMRQGRYRDTVRGAVRWLREQQDPNGRFGPAASSDFIYDHAIAAYAMSEAYGLSQYSLLAPVAQRGIDYLQAHRNPYGAWRYQPRDGDNDTSVTCWCIMALTSGRHWGLTVDSNALAMATTFLDSCTTPDGRCGYSRAGQPSARKVGDQETRFPAERTEALTAAGLFARFCLGQDPKEKDCMRAAADRLVAQRPNWDTKAGTIDHYYWYYGSYALFQIGGNAWREWSKALTPAVLKTQRTDGNANGSWDPIDAWGEDGGRVYSTAILALTLEAYFRYTRLVPAAK